MNLFNFRFLAFLIVLVASISASGQVNSIAQKFKTSASFGAVQDMSGDGRFAVFVSTGDDSTVVGSRNNSDGNYEIFLFDYAQRHVFQITNTKELLVNPSGSTTDPNNIRLHIYNLNARISNDGHWIVFTSNATTSTVGSPNSTNPGNFDANAYTDQQGNNTINQLAVQKTIPADRRGDIDG